MINKIKYRKLFATLSIFSFCAPYSNRIQAMEEIKQMSKFKKLSIDLLKKILKFETFTEEEKNGLISSSILRLRQNIGIPECHLKVNVNDLPILIQYTVLETYNSLLEIDPEYKNYIQRTYLKEGYHNFAILGIKYKSSTNLESVFKPYLGSDLRGSQTVIVKNPIGFLGMVVDFNNYTVLAINNPELNPECKSLMNDYLVKFKNLKYANGRSIIDEVKTNLKKNNIKCDSKVLSILYAMFNAIHEFGHLLHRCKCVTSGIKEKNYTFDDEPWNIEISAAYMDYFSGSKFKELFPKSNAAKKLFDYLDTEHYEDNLFTAYGIKLLPKRGYSELWADSFALALHPFTDKNGLRDQFVDDFFHGDNQYNISEFNKNKMQRADYLKQYNYLIKKRQKIYYLRQCN